MYVLNKENVIKQWQLKTLEKSYVEIIMSV